MKKKPCCILILALLLSTYLQAQYSGGNGTIASPYEIGNLTDLENLSTTSTDWDKHFVQISDIDASATANWNAGLGFSPIGSNSQPFSGTYDGQNHTITNLSINRPSAQSIGLFGRTFQTSEIHNLGLIGGVVIGDYHVGGIVGYNNGHIENCFNTGDVIGSSAGGLVGSHWGVLISKSYTSGNISGDYEVGGLVGKSVGQIENCYARGNVTGNDYVGGLVGFSDYFILNSYSTGIVTGTNFVGGLVGVNFGSVNSNSFWDMQTSGQTTSADGIGKTTADMKMQSTFTNAGWDFTSIWSIVPNRNDGYPDFCSHVTTTVIVCDTYTWPENGMTYTVSGTYSIVYGCSSDILNLTITDSPSNQVTQSGDALTATETNAAYQWFICELDGTFTSIPAATNQTYVATAIGSYMVEVTKNDCTVVSECIDVTTLGINENNSSNFIYFPNPTTGIITIQHSIEISEISIFNLQGQLIKKQLVNKLQTDIDLSELPDAVYLLKIVTERKQKTIKVVKK